MAIHRSTRLPQARPLAIALAGLGFCATSLAAAHDAATTAANLRDVADRFGVSLMSAPPPHTTAVVTNCDDSGPGSLRDTLMGAASDDAIDLTQLPCSRITLTTGAIVFGQSNIQIDGPGRDRLMIDGGLSDGVFYHAGFGTLIVNDLSVGYGFKYRSDVDVTGGCIHSSGNILLRDSRVTTCIALSTAGYSALGGGVFAAGQMQLERSIVTTSEAKSKGTGYASGGGVYAINGVVSSYSTLSYNVALGDGGAPSYGGGIFARGTSLVLGSTISGNQALLMGGIAFVDYNDSPVTLVNSTVSGNRSTRIGGIFAYSPLSIYNSTIAFNTSHEWTDGAGHYFAAGVHIMQSGEMDSSIIASNVNDGAPFPTADLTGNTGAGFLGGHNDVMLCGAPCPNDTSHDDPGLLALLDNGGLTRTHMPTPGNWDAGGGSNVLSLAWEQRGPGFPRRAAGDFPEIGAVQISSDFIFANGFN